MTDDPVVVDVAAVLHQHQRNGRECSCLFWDWRECDFDLHQAHALHAAHLIGYQPALATGLARLLHDDNTLQHLDPDNQDGTQ